MVGHTSGNTRTGFQSKGTIRQSKELTVDEIESDHGTIRDPPVVDWFALSYNGIPQRHEVPNGRTRPDVLQVRSNGAILAVFRKVLDLLFGRVDSRVQLVEVLFVELSRDGLVDGVGHCVLPERRLFLW
jgi:hypothetical protein